LSTITGKSIPPLTPGSQDWLKTISASKIPAILGISPWQSRYALWHLMAGNTEPWAGNKNTERGTYLENAVFGWFEAQHPELTVVGSGSYAHNVHASWTAAPDGIAHQDEYDEDEGPETYGVEIKTAQYSDGWGKAGTAELPPYYLAQVAWQMIVTGVDRVYVPVLFGQPFEFREYVVEWDDIAGDVDAIKAEVHAFQRSLADGVAPDIDGSSATYNTIKELHPDIDGETVEIPEDLGTAYLYAKETLDMATGAADKYKNEIAATMGTAKKATLYGQPFFTRQARGGGTPYLVAARTLPALVKNAA
jgi:putative phage-type endonuclease